MGADSGWTGEARRLADEMRCAIGIDLGGTKVAAAVVDDSGRIHGKGHRATEAQRGPAAVIGNMAKAVEEALAATPPHLREQVQGIGVGAPGIIDAAAGTVLLAPNLRWENLPLRALLEERFGQPVAMDNDANCAALGEQWAGAARGRRHVVMVTLGTGVGGGLILDGRIYRGAGGFAGELGHIPVDEDGPPCGCGRRGCLEVYASASAIAARGREAVAAGHGRAIRAQARRTSRGQIDARAVLAAAQKGDPTAAAIVREAAGRLGWTLAGVVNALNPEVIVVGGGISRAGNLLLDPVRAEVARRALGGPAGQVEIVAARLGNEAGLVGAASLLWR